MEFPANERLGVGIARMAMDVGHVASSGDTHLATGTLSPFPAGLWDCTTGVHAECPCTCWTIMAPNGS
jgi:hypothetical protein